ncbi:MAG: site-specific DNA-methyltransferase, partial [Acidobacteria bacterium]|nr:site-specific DNA-methyltransferase [Acidobacteriota bacterium]
GWSKAIEVGKLPEGDERPVVVDMDPAADPVLFWSGKRNKREVSVLPLQRNEIVSESRIAQIIDRARRAAEEKSGAARQGHLFADLEKTLRETDRKKRVEFYTHEEGGKNKLICGDSLHVMESLLHYDNLRGKVQMIYIDPPYGIDYDSNFQQRIDSPNNDPKATGGDDILAIRAFRDTWALGVHSYLSYLADRLYLCRELLKASGSVIVQVNDAHIHLVRILMSEVFGEGNFVALIPFRKKTMPLGSKTLENMSDYLVWYARDKEMLTYRPVFVEQDVQGKSRWTWFELPDGSRHRMTSQQALDHRLLPAKARVFRLVSQRAPSFNATNVFPVVLDGQTYRPPTGGCWVTNEEGMKTLAEARRLLPEGDNLSYVLYHDDFPLSVLTNPWHDTTGPGKRVYSVQTGEKVVERCLWMTTVPGDIVLDPTCGSGTTALCAERWGRRWITIDTSRVAVNTARRELLANTFAHFKLATTSVDGGFKYRRTPRITSSTVINKLEPEQVELVDDPEVDPVAIRVCGPFEVMSLGRYSVEDWKGYVVREPGVGEAAKFENYIEVICRLYRRDAAIQGATGLVHAVAETEKEKIAISVGPLSGRVSGKQINDAVQDALASGILEVHVHGWAFEANVGEVKSQLEKRGKVKVELIMIRPDTLAEGLKATQPEMLFSPLALPDIEVAVAKNGKEKQVHVTLNGVALFDRKRRSTEYKAADSGYVSAWYLDEDYDGDCFVDCQMFFDFKKTPNIKAALKAEVDPKEFVLKLDSEPFPVRGYKRIAVKVVDVYGNESTIVRDLE